MTDMYYGDLNDETIIVFDVEENGIDNDVIRNFPVVGMNVDTQAFGFVTRTISDSKILDRIDLNTITSNLKDSINSDIIRELKRSIFAFASAEEINRTRIPGSMNTSYFEQTHIGVEL